MKSATGFGLMLGVRHPSSRLTQEQVLAIRKSRQPNRVLARQYGVSATAIGKIKKRLTWQWLKDDGTVRKDRQ